MKTPSRLPRRPFARPLSLTAAACLAASLTLPNTEAQSQTPRTTLVSQEKTYNVRIQTSLNVPPKTEYSRVLVQHIVPSTRPWTKIRNGAGAKSIKTSPNGAITRYDNTLKTTVVEWNEKIPTKGGALSFTTSYEVPTASRGLKPEAFKRTKWVHRNVQGGGNEELRQMAEKILKEEKTAAEGLIKFSQWMVGRIKYDNSVINTSLEDIMKNGAGHCGHRAAVFQEFCRMLSIPTRIVSGMALLSSGGSDDKNDPDPAADDAHTWVEVNLPGVGWVEAEPTNGAKLFTVPETFIQTKGFQTHRVRLLQNGTWVDHAWERQENSENPKEKPKKVSPVGLKTTVSFNSF